MREIKFRARSANVPRCWIYGYFAIIEGQCFIFNEDGKFPVIAGTECQYSGERDENGKEVYEEDEVEYLGCALGGLFPGTSKRIVVKFNKGVFYPFDMLRGKDIRIIGDKKKTKIKVSITKHLNFRAFIEEPGKPVYEVTVGGKSWNEGKGKKYKPEILNRMTKISSKLLSELYEIIK